MKVDTEELAVRDQSYLINQTGDNPTTGDEATFQDAKKTRKRRTRSAELDATQLYLNEIGY